MSRIALVTDTTTNLPAEWAESRGVHVIPVYIRFGDTTYRDGVDMDAATFYRRLKESPTMPATSQPSVGDFLELYRRLSREASAIVSIHLSAEMSGTMASALAAREQLLSESAEPPEVHVVDSRATSGASALLVSAAADAIAAGHTASDVVRRVEEVRGRLFSAFVVDTLEYLHRGGRIGLAAHLVGSLLQLKPILYFRDGKVAPLEKVRTARRAKERLLEVVAERAGGRPIRAAVAHAQAPEEAERIRRHLEQHFDCRELMVVEFSPVVGAHGGPGTVGVALYTV